MLRPIVPVIGQGLLIDGTPGISYTIVKGVDYHERLFEDHHGVDHEWANIRLDQGCGLADLGETTLPLFIRWAYLRSWYLAEYSGNFEKAEGKGWKDGPGAEFRQLTTELEAFNVVKDWTEMMPKWERALAEAEEIQMQQYKRSRRAGDLSPTTPFQEI